MARRGTSPQLSLLALLGTLALVAGVLTGCGTTTDQHEASPSSSRSAASAASAGTAASAALAPAAYSGKQVLAISIDGLNPSAITKLGRSRLPAFYRLADQGAYTWNARTEYEQTVTLPNHASMMTGRRVDRTRHGHGVTWDDDRTTMTVQKAAGHAVDSVFTNVHAAGRGTALFSTKVKFGLYNRSWDSAIDRYYANDNESETLRAAKADLVTANRAFTFLHLALPDKAGHQYGGMTSGYLSAVDRTDELLGALLAAVDRRPALKSRLVIVLTSDHGFRAGSTAHDARTSLDNYRIPFVIWGSGVRHAGLYTLNPTRKYPSTSRTTYSGSQPVRNGDVANLSLDLLGLGPVRSSLFDYDQRLNWR